jgi:hypothetical protein
MAVPGPVRERNFPTQSSAFHSFGVREEFQRYFNGAEHDACLVEAIVGSMAFLWNDRGRARALATFHSRNCAGRRQRPGSD